MAPRLRLGDPVGAGEQVAESVRAVGRRGGRRGDGRAGGVGAVEGDGRSDDAGLTGVADPVAVDVDEHGSGEFGEGVAEVGAGSAGVGRWCGHRGRARVERRAVTGRVGLGDRVAPAGREAREGVRAGSSGEGRPDQGVGAVAELEHHACQRCLAAVDRRVPVTVVEHDPGDPARAGRCQDRPVGLAEVVGGEQATGGQDDRADRVVGDRSPGGAGVVESVGVECRLCLGHGVGAGDQVAERPAAVEVADGGLRHGVGRSVGAGERHGGAGDADLAGVADPVVVEVDEDRPSDRPQGLAEVLSIESVERYDDGIDGVGRGAREAGRLRLDERVAAGCEVLEAVAAVGVGREGPDRRAERIEQRDRDIGDAGLAGVDDAVAIAVGEHVAPDPGGAGATAGQSFTEVLVRQAGDRHGQRSQLIGGGRRVPGRLDLADPVRAGGDAGEGVVAVEAGHLGRDDGGRAVEQLHRDAGQTRFAGVQRPVAVGVEVHVAAHERRAGAAGGPDLAERVGRAVAADRQHDRRQHVVAEGADG